MDNLFNIGRYGRLCPSLQKKASIPRDNFQRRRTKTRFSNDNLYIACMSAQRSKPARIQYTSQIRSNPSNADYNLYLASKICSDFIAPVLEKQHYARPLKSRDNLRKIRGFVLIPFPVPASHNKYADIVYCLGMFLFCIAYLWSIHFSDFWQACLVLCADGGISVRIPVPAGPIIGRKSVEPWTSGAPFATNSGPAACFSRELRYAVC